MEKVDITIIGAGVVGLAIAAEIARPDLSVFILEKNPKHGHGISSRNSEVIHSGIYYPGNSLKASLCIKGNKMLYDLAAKNSIPHRRTGKLIVAVSPEEIEEIERLYANGRNNGVTSISIISKKQIAKMEPNVQAQAALYSPDTGIISAHDLMNYFLADALNKKAKISHRTKVVHIEKNPATIGFSRIAIKAKASNSILPLSSMRPAWNPIPSPIWWGTITNCTTAKAIIAVFQE